MLFSILPIGIALTELSEGSASVLSSTEIGFELACANLFNPTSLISDNPYPVEAFPPLQYTKCTISLSSSTITFVLGRPEEILSPSKECSVKLRSSGLYEKITLGKAEVFCSATVPILGVNQIISLQTKPVINTSVLVDHAPVG